MSIQNISALPGFYVITPQLHNCGTPVDISLDPIIGWHCDNDWSPVPITMSGMQENCAVLRPDGSVKSPRGTFENVYTWGYLTHPKANLNCRCEVTLKDAHPGFFALENCRNLDVEYIQFEVLKTPIIAWAIGADGNVYPVSQGGILWKNPPVLNPDGSVYRSCDESWSSVDAWVANLVKIETQVEAARAAKAARAEALKAKASPPPAAGEDLI